MRKEDSSAQGQIVTEILQHLHVCNNSVKVRKILTLICKIFIVILKTFKYYFPGILWKRRKSCSNRRIYAWR